MVRAIVVVVVVPAGVSRALAREMELAGGDEAGYVDDARGRGHGALNCVYCISLSEVTAAQYTLFFNAETADHTSGLHNGSGLITPYRRRADVVSQSIGREAICHLPRRFLSAPGHSEPSTASQVPDLLRTP